MSDTPDRSEPYKERSERIAREEQRIRELQAEIDRRRAVVCSLRAEGDELGNGMVSAQNPVATELLDSTHLSREQKIRLFRSLFRGRDDLFPRLWVNRKTGLNGYSPACANEWEPGLCGKKGSTSAKRRSNCAECLTGPSFP
jgi:hypothetical protein